MRQFLLQLAGMPGSGKSTLAQAIGETTGAVVLDKDVVKSAALNAGAPEELAAPLAYEVFFDLAKSIAGYGHSLVLDSPAFFTNIPQKGQRIAAQLDTAYALIECTCPDEALLSRSLADRKPLPSQWSALRSAELSLAGRGPLNAPHLTIDTREPLASCLRQALEYIGYDAG